MTIPRSLRSFIVGCCVVGACLTPLVARGQEKIPAPSVVPTDLPHGDYEQLNQNRQALTLVYADFRKAADIFGAKAARDQTDEEFESLQGRRADYIQSAKSFNEAVEEAKRAQVIIGQMNAFAASMPWSGEKKARVADALRDLGFDGDPSATGEQIRETWQAILSRGPLERDSREADRVEGIGTAGAGTQAGFQDCTIFALANAAGLPYGVVATRAGELLREAAWRDDGERANPQRVIEKSGLIGGEVVLLAEIFGQIEVVSFGDFSEVLKEGRPLLINVVPFSGDTKAGHEVVLTRSFQHMGETWYAMMDSNQGPIRRLFLSELELGVLLQEKGVAFRPEAERTVLQLRPPEDQ